METTYLLQTRGYLAVYMVRVILPSRSHEMAEQEELSTLTEQELKDTTFTNVKKVFAEDGFKSLLCRTPHGEVCLSLKYIPVG